MWALLQLFIHVGMLSAKRTANGICTYKKCKCMQNGDFYILRPVEQGILLMSRICFRLLLLDGAYFNFKDMPAIAVLDRAYFSFRTCLRWTWPKGTFLFYKGWKRGSTSSFDFCRSFYLIYEVCNMIGHCQWGWKGMSWVSFDFSFQLLLYL